MSRSLHVLTLCLQLPAASYGEPARISGFYDQLVERLGALAGVDSAGAGSSLAACGIPARRAMQVEPVIALRGDP